VLLRAYRREDYFTATSDELMQVNAYAFVTQRAAAAWLALRLDLLGLIILTVAGEWSQHHQQQGQSVAFILTCESQAPLQDQSWCCQGHVLKQGTLACTHVRL
jgi:hypothetical protein